MKRTIRTLFALAVLFVAAGTMAQPAGGFGGFQQQAELHTSQQWKDVNYAGDSLAFHTCDIYLPAQERPAYPVVIHIYGSAWFSNSGKGQADLGTIVNALLNAGYAVVCPNHRSSMDAKWPAQLHDIRAVIRFVRGEAATYKFDTSFIATSGFSSGGHLASIAATTSGMRTATVGSITLDLEGSVGNYTNMASTVNAACDWSGPVDLTAMDCGEHITMGNDSPEDVLLASKIDREPDKYVGLSATNYIDPNDPPVIIFHGEQDNVVPCCQGKKFYELLQAAGVRCEATFVPGGGHGIGMYSEENLQKMVAFLNSVRGSSPGLPLQGNAVPFGRGRLTVTTVAHNAVRIQYAEAEATSDLPDWIYVSSSVPGGFPAGKQGAMHGEVANADICTVVDSIHQTVSVKDRNGATVFTATCHRMDGSEATLSFASPADEYLFGLGQFQDGYSNVRGLSRRLTQVNTQISLPMLLSSKGYGILWNNYGMTEFNPCSRQVRLTVLPSSQSPGATEVVNVTTTTGGSQEVRQHNIFQAELDIAETADYSLLLDVGQKMARRHNLVIDGQVVINMQNLWLPPTASAIVHLTAGRHTVTAELTKDDRPVLYYNKVREETVFRSPVANAVDYTVFIGSPDEVIATYRELTGPCPLMPSWALGYIHCRERFHSSQEILETANRFRSEGLPLDVIVQDWQYWGKYGWNSMRFDEDYYPDPRALTDSLHSMGVRLMVSVWSKIDKNSDVGREMLASDYYIPGTDWIDFFNPDAAAAYWRNFSERLVPLGIDAWWQDATEPENDDLAGRRVNRGRWAGEQVRNVYPLLVNKTVYEGLAHLSPPEGGTIAPSISNTIEAPSGAVGGASPFILTRCGFPGIQRYGSALWSGDVGNDWETFRRQIVAGLGVQAAGIPWWTYDAGGFFRPGDQYTNQDYIERMLRWIETSVYLPLMRVHGYMSNTEPWNYGPEAQAIIAECLHQREQLRPYLEQCARRIAEEGYTLMRPLVFDFADDPVALQQKHEYMFGPALLISPVTEPGVTQWNTYLPRNAGGWTDCRTGQHYDGGQTVTTPVDKARIPVFLRAGQQNPFNQQ